MADALGWDYFDREVILRIAQEQGMDADYVGAVLDRHPWQSMPLTFRSSFSAAYQDTQTNLLVKEKQIIDGIAKAGRDCVIVGRNADVYLADRLPFSLFVCADMPARIQRCRERGSADQMSDKDLERNIRRIDKNRAATRDMIGGRHWGDPTSYCMTVNTTDWEIKRLAPLMARFARHWFEQIHVPPKDPDD